MEYHTQDMKVKPTCRVALTRLKEQETVPCVFTIPHANTAEKGIHRRASSQFGPTENNHVGDKGEGRRKRKDGDMKDEDDSQITERRR